MDTKTALITGSAKGLGRAMAIHLARKGYDIVIHYQRSEQAAIQLKQELETLDRRVIVQQADVTKEPDVKRMMDEIGKVFGQLDVLINNVGNYIKKNIIDTSVNEWHAMLDSNLNSTFYCIHHALPWLHKSSTNHTSHIVNIGFASLGQATAQTMVAPYYIAKNGVLILTKSLAKELAAKNINVNMLSPGVLENSESKPVSEIPKNRLATFAEFNHVLDMLLAPEGQYLTGVNIEVAGGWKL
ncbi:MAG TPA: bifunctional dihydropteridine reductase/dihydrofolate reductase TmpR [Microscillaceae bacterium]|nr:bifunctional dihydropteridine reductase/dihydrofolate reductase TmpR [Microscillaceae bacterium]